MVLGLGYRPSSLLMLPRGLSHFHPSGAYTRLNDELGADVIA